MQTQVLQQVERVDQVAEKVRLRVRYARQQCLEQVQRQVWPQGLIEVERQFTSRVWRPVWQVRRYV